VPRSEVYRWLERVRVVKKAAERSHEWDCRCHYARESEKSLGSGLLLLGIGQNSECQSVNQTGINHREYLEQKIGQPSYETALHQSSRLFAPESAESRFIGFKNKLEPTARKIDSSHKFTASPFNTGSYLLNTTDRAD